MCGTRSGMVAMRGEVHSGSENYDNYLPGLASCSLTQQQARHAQLWENELSCLLWYLHLALIITSLVYRNFTARCGSKLNPVQKELKRVIVP